MKKFNNLGSEKNKTTSTEYKLILDTLFRMNYFKCLAISFYGSVVRQLFKRLSLNRRASATGGEATDRVTEPVKFF